jgi:hypothetical protein
MSSFLKEIDPALYMQYQRESFEEKNQTYSVVEEVPLVMETIRMGLNNVMLLSVRMSDIEDSHFAKQYINGRGIPKQFHNDILFVENMNAWVKLNIDPDQESPTDPHIVILIRNKDGVIVGANGRSLKPKDNFSKYCKAKISAEVKLIFGIERVKAGKKVYATEGEFDSMFIENCVAVGGINNMIDLERELLIPKEQLVLVMDKDYRNKQVVKNMERLIDCGYNLVLLPPNISGKDINEIVVNNKYPTQYLMKLLEENTFNGLMAKLQLSKLRRT